MKINEIIRVIAGSFIILSVLAYQNSTPEISIFSEANFLWFTLFVGANLLQSGFTKWCLMETFLQKLGFKH